MKTLCVLDPRWTWKDWIDSHGKGRPILTLDPAVLPGRLTLQDAGRVRAWRFSGSCDPGRSPLNTLSGAVALAQAAGDRWVAFLFHPGQSILLNELALQIAQCLQPSEILVPEGSSLDSKGWPIGAQSVQLEPGFPPVVREAQRRAQWLDFTQSCTEFTAQLTDFEVMGARIGQGIPFFDDRLKGLAWAWGSHLHVIAQQQPSDDLVSQWCAMTHTQRLNFARPSDYEGLLCATSEQDGRDLGMATIREIDLESGSITLAGTLDGPFRILKVGTVRIDSAGRELGEVKPWTV